MTCEQAFFERPTPRVQRPEPDPLFSLAERLAAWSHEFGAPATDREWTEALESGQIHPPQTQAAETLAAEHSTV